METTDLGDVGSVSSADLAQDALADVHDPTRQPEFLAVERKRGSKLLSAQMQVFAQNGERPPRRRRCS